MIGALSLKRLREAVDVRRDRGWSRAGTAEAAVRALQEDAGADDPVLPEVRERLTELGDRLGLTGAEQALLAIAWLAEQSTAAHLLLGLLSGDEGPNRPSVALALELAGEPATAESARRWLTATGPLLRAGLLATDGSDVLISRRLRLIDRVADYLAGATDLPPPVRRLLVDTIPVEVEGAELVVAALSAGHQLIWLHSVPGGSGAALAAAACGRLQVRALVVDLARVRTDPADDAVSAVLLEATLHGLAVVLLSAERADVTALQRAFVPVIGVSPTPWDAAWSSDLPITLTAPRLPGRYRSAVWKQAFGGLSGPQPAADVLTDPILAAMPLSPEQIAAVARHARDTAEVDGEPEISVERVRRSVRQLGRGRAVRARAAGAVDDTVTLRDLVMTGHALDEVHRLIEWARHREDVVALGPVHGKGGKGTGICALFTGPPGTGKTLAAHVVADAVGMDLYQIELPSIVDKYIGETEKNLERVFSEAEALNALLFFDEADSLFGSRSEVKDARDRYANQEVAYLLQRMEQFDGLTVLASNLRGNIDPAFARRLHFIISFPEPDAPTRRRLWEHHLAGLPLDAGDPVDVPALAAAVEVTGGDIRNIVLAAVHSAVAEQSSLGMRHVVPAVRRELLKLGRRPPEEFASSAS